MGQRFIDDLDSSQGVISDVLGSIRSLRDDTGRQLARIELTRQYLGFASRYLKYLDLQRKSRGGRRR